MTFLDSEVPGLLGEPDDLAMLHLRCVAGVRVARWWRAGGLGRDPSGRASASGDRMAIVLVGTGAALANCAYHLIVHVG